MKTAPTIMLSDDERKTLTTWSRGRSTPARLVLRAKIVLAAAEGKTNDAIAAELNTSKPTVGAVDSPLGERPELKRIVTHIEPAGDAAATIQSQAGGEKLIDKALQQYQREKKSIFTRTISWSIRPPGS
jgi:hypothetical protein